MAEEIKKTEEPKPPIVGAVREPPEPVGPSALMREALGRYGIKPDHMLSSKEYRDHVVIVTKGGSKVSYAPGDAVKPLSKAQLDGVPAPKPAKK